jgi:hypothetical protein
MPLAGFEPTIPVFKRAKTFHTLDLAATVTGNTNTPEHIKFLLNDCEAYIAEGCYDCISNFKIEWTSNITVFGDLTQCSPVDSCRDFGGTCASIIRVEEPLFYPEVLTGYTVLHPRRRQSSL